MENHDQLPDFLADKKQLRKRKIISYSVFLFMLIIAITFRFWISSQPSDNGISRPLRSGLNVNDKIFESLFNKDKAVKEYPIEAAVKKVRVNGFDGIRSALDSSGWRLKVVRDAGDTIYITLDELKLLPKKDIIFDFKCIEGWDQVTHWAGVSMQDFIHHYHLEKQANKKYIGLVTPDKGYYVGIDMPSALQSQTILCYEMNGNPLPLNQGYPLRLIIPVKYGIKHLKRIGTMTFSDTPPPDFWAERGYDYYAGH